jgi:hypothetical protein
LADDAADNIYATPDLRITAAIAATGQAATVDDGYRVGNHWMWNTAGIHSNWLACARRVPGEEHQGLMLLPTTEVDH